MKKLACLVMTLGVLALMSVPLLTPLSQSAYLLLLGVAAFLGVLSSYRLECEAVSLLVMGSLIFYRPDNSITGLCVAGIALVFFHARIYLEALFSKTEVSITKSILFLLATTYSFFLICYWQVIIFVSRSVLAKHCIDRVWYGVMKYFTPIFGYVLLGEVLILLLFKRKQSTLLSVLYTLLTFCFTATVVLMFHAMMRIWLLTFGGIVLLAAGKTSKQRVLQVLGCGVLGFTALLVLSKFVVLKVIRHR